jgi:hypothetical protein
VAWYLNGKVLRRRSFGVVQVWALNIFTSLFRAVDGILPCPPLSLIAILENPLDADRSKHITQAYLKGLPQRRIEC